MEKNDWGLQLGNLTLEDSFISDFDSSESVDEYENVIFGKKISFPLKFLYQVIFVGGKRGSGKSWTAGVMMEELNRLGLQFVCFDALDAHGHLSELNGIESIQPSRNESINMQKLIKKLKKGNSSLVINLSQIPLDTQHKLVSEYCENMLETDFSGNGVMTILEECQDFVPQLGRPPSFNPIVRLCKLGRAKGYGVTLISQRPAAVSKEALSQASIYMIHNVINTKDLEAVREQLSFGTDKNQIRKITDGINYASPGEMVCYAPEFFKDKGFIVVGNVDRPRRVEHSGSNIEVVSQRGGFMTPYESDNSFENENDVSEFEDNYESENEISENYELGGPVGSGEEPLVDKYEWAPYDWEGVEYLSENTSPSNKPFNAMVAISLLSTGVYLITRGIAKSTK
tara:strand:- start:110 stop:1306 length:1197 start_codon:yes stop_codon:yes gene_type:complete